jgi:hypothetical protein
MIHQLKIDLDASLHAGSSKRSVTPSRFGFTCDVFTKVREFYTGCWCFGHGRTALPVCVSDTCRGEVNLRRIDIGDKNHATARKSIVILWASILSFLTLPPWIALMLEGIT